jgi:hypothetical protein
MPSFLGVICKDVDGRDKPDKPGHDEDTQTHPQT